MIPKLRKNFSLSIETADSDLVESFTTIEKQTVTVDLGTELLTTPDVTHAKGNLILWLADDEACQLMLAVRKIQQKSPIFTLFVSLNNKKGGMVERFTFTECKISAIQHSIMSIEPISDVLKLKGKLASGEKIELTGELRSSTARENVMKLLQVEFFKMKHEFITAIV